MIFIVKLVGWGPAQKSKLMSVVKIPAACVRGPTHNTQLECAGAKRRSLLGGTQASSSRAGCPKVIAGLPPVGPMRRVIGPMRRVVGVGADAAAVRVDSTHAGPAPALEAVVEPPMGHPPEITRLLLEGAAHA
jgi:hypothetical protein